MKNRFILEDEDIIVLENKKQLNGGPGSGNPNPGQGRGRGKPAGGGAPLVHEIRFTNHDDVSIKIGEKEIKGELEHRDGKWGIAYKDDGFLILSESDWWKLHRIKKASVKEREAKLKELEEAGIKQKTPKERQTESQKKIIDNLDKMGILHSDTKEWLLANADEDILKEIETQVQEIKKLGLDTKKLKLKRKKTGLSVWGNASIGSDGYNFKFVGQMLDGNPLKVAEITADSEGFHTDDSIKGTVRHELGHIMSYYVANSGANPRDTDSWGREDMHADAAIYCRRLIANATGKKNASVWEINNYVENAPQSDISRYGRKNVYEYVAESYSNPDYSPITRKIADEMTQDLKNLKEGKPVIFNKKEDNDEIEICSGYGPEEVVIKEGKLQVNGGKNSGNHNPGRGRGIGKPNNEGARLSKATKSFEEYVSKSNQWMPSPERFYAIADSLGYTGEPKIVNDKEFEKAKKSGDYIPMFRGFRGDIYSGITATEAVEDFLYGDYYAGNGQSRFGDGIYLAGEEGYATHYSESISDTQTAVLRMLVPKGNYIEIQEDGKFRNKAQQEKFENYYQTKRDEYSAKADELTKKAGQLYKEGHINEGEKVYDEVEKMNDLSCAYGDLKYAQTEYAMIQGYDGVHWDAAKDNDALKEEYVVFDRSKIIVQKPDFL